MSEQGLRLLAAALAIGIGGVETYRQFLGPAPRRINGFGPEAQGYGYYGYRNYSDYRYYRNYAYYSKAE